MVLPPLLHAAANTFQFTQQHFKASAAGPDPALEELLLLVEEDRGRGPASFLPSRSNHKPALQHPHADPPAPLPTTRSSSHGLPGGLPSAAPDAGPHVTQRTQWQSAEPSSMHQALSAQPPQSVHRGWQGMHLPPGPSAVLPDAMPVMTPPPDTTWLQSYAAGLGQGQEQASLLQPTGQGHLLQAPQQSGPNTNSTLLPPALAHQNPHTGQWVPTLLPINQFAIALLAQADEEGTELPHQCTADRSVVYTTRGENSHSFKKHILDHMQGPANVKKVRTAAGLTLAAVHAVEAHTSSRPQEQSPAHSANHEHTPDDRQTVPGQLLARGQPGQAESLHQDIWMQQPQGFSQQPQGFSQQPQGFLQQPLGFPPQPQGSCQQPQLDTRSQAAAPGLHQQHPGSVDHFRSHHPTASGFSHDLGPSNWQQHQQGAGHQHQYHNGHGPAWLQQQANGSVGQHQIGNRAGPRAVPEQVVAGKGRLHHELMEFSALASPSEVRQLLPTGW